MPHSMGDYVNIAVVVTLVFIGGAVGSVLRWLVGMTISRWLKAGPPIGTLVINVSGAFLMGFLSTLFYVDWNDRYGSALTALVLTGLLGGYTTFSSYQLDAATLYGKGQRLLAIGYWAGSIALGLGAAILGYAAASMIGGR